MQTVSNLLIAPLAALIGVVIGGWLTHHWSAKRDLENERRKLRISWINNLRERIPEIIQTAGWFYLSSMKSNTPPSEEEAWSPEKTSQTLKLVYQITQVELMLDLRDETHIEIRNGMNAARTCAFARGERLIQFEVAVDNLKQSCLVVLKQETARLNERSWR
ncbi:MAG TPA: hypothetical protein VIJ79_00210 [Acidobacteriaceae bacterium]